MALAFSYSRISMFNQCPLSLQKYLAKEPVEKGKPLLVGGWAHGFYERYGLHCLKTGQQTDLEAVRGLAREAFTEAEEPGLTEADFDENYEPLIAQFADKRMFRPQHIVGIEEKIAIDPRGCQVDWFNKSTWFRGVIDLLEMDGEVAYVTDYKAGWATDVNKLQADIYAWLILLLYPHIEEVEVSFYYVRHDVQKPFTYTRGQCDAIDARVRELCDAITKRVEDQDLPPAPGPHCLHCQYAATCPVKAEAPAGAIVDLSQAQHAVEQIALLERDLAAYKKYLRDWCTANGDVVHNGANWGHHAQGGMGFNEAWKFVDACVDSGIDPWPFVSVNGTSVKKLINKGTGEFPPALQAVAVNKRSTRFGHQKVKS